MEMKKNLNFILFIIVIILGVTLFKHFDFENLKFEKPKLAVVYIITFTASLYLLIKRPKENSIN